MNEVQSIPEFVAAHGIRRIAYPINFSSVSDNGLAWAINLANQHQAELLLLHVVPPPTPIFELESPLKSEASVALSMLLGKLETAGLNVRGFLLTGTSYKETQIVRAARLERVDLIIMSTRRRIGIAKLFTGSLASRVISHAHCPVLVVPS